MTDITKCTNNVCSMKKDCYRYTAPDDDRVKSHVRFSPRSVLFDGGCNHWVANLNFIARIARKKIRHSIHRSIKNPWELYLKELRYGKNKYKQA
jgi:hypothetical protein